MKLLVAYDGSDYARAAVHDLSRAGLPATAEVLVAAVADRQPEAAETAIEGAKLLSKEWADWSVRAEGLVGSPAMALIEMADEWQPDLLVAGSHGRTAFGRFLLGSVSHKLVGEARCSVRVARQHPQPRIDPPKIVIGVDGSDGAAATVQEVATRCWPAGTEILVVAALEASRDEFEDGEHHEHVAMQLAEWEAARTAQAEGVATSALETLRRPGLVSSAKVGRGSPKRLLIEAAANLMADSIFLGAAGAGQTGEHLLGSSAVAVVMQAPCSVEIIRKRSATYR